MNNKPFNAPDTASETARMRLMADIETGKDQPEPHQVASFDQKQQELRLLISKAFAVAVEINTEKSLDAAGHLLNAHRVVRGML